MSHPKDLHLDYKFTDRGGHDVFDITEEIISTGCMEGEKPRRLTVGEIRLSQNHKLVSFKWHHALQT